MLQYPDFSQRTPGSKMGFLKTWLKSGHDVYMHKKTWSYMALWDRFRNDCFTVLRQLNNQQKRRRSRFILAHRHWFTYTVKLRGFSLPFRRPTCTQQTSCRPKVYEIHVVPCRVAGCELIRRPESEHHCGQTEETVCRWGLFVWLSSGKAAPCCCCPARC